MFEGATPENLIYMAEALVQDSIEPTRRQLGAHYTSEANIMKVIRPLFLDEWTQKVKNSTKHELKHVHDQLRNLTFLDPACGCGNFLIVAFRELRRLEHELVERMGGSKKDVSISALNFKGLEISEFPAKVAEAALWMMEQLMELEGARTLEVADSPHLPLPKEKVIRVCDALAVEWPHVDYIMGNPPFVGSKMMSLEQRASMSSVFPDKGSGSADFVSAWFIRAADYIRDGCVVCASFVAHNSINQGMQKPIVNDAINKRECGVTYSPSFKWNNEARGKQATVHVVVGKIGKGIKTDSSVKPRNKPFSEVPVMKFGNKSLAADFLFLSEDERCLLINKYPEVEYWIRPYLGGSDLINSEIRYCLWLREVEPQQIKRVPEVLDRVNSVREFRLSKGERSETYGLADVPYLFATNREPKSRYLAVARVSSNRRDYIPMAFVEKEVLPADDTLFISGADCAHFSVLLSALHMSWMRATSGRLGMGYRYGVTNVYNTFVWPELTDQNKEQLTKLGQAILDARANHPDCTLADLYDPLAMPTDLRKAHNANDKYVDSLYGLKNATEETRLAELMKRYQEAVKPR